MYNVLLFSLGRSYRYALLLYHHLNTMLILRAHIHVIITTSYIVDF